MPRDRSVGLASLEKGEEATVRRVNAQDPAVLRHLDELGLIPGAHVKILKISPFDQVMQLQIKGRGQPSVLGPALTRQVYVEAP
jgi:DtxR family Mn-dependent transcriptional regulator